MTPTTAAEAFVPADTRTMPIVHNPIRRDLARARRVLTTVPYPHDRQREALAAHLLMVMHFLEKHHSDEEKHLYSLVRPDPSTHALLDEMEAQHDSLEPGIAALQAAAAAYAKDPEAREQVIAALDLLAEPLLPHLDREESVLMPVVQRTVSKADWDAAEQKVVKQRSLPDLAREGLWILDGTTPEEQALMTALIPALAQWIMVHVYGRGHRKRCFARWWSPEYSPWKTNAIGSNSVTAAATPEQVWAVLADVTRNGEWSHECRSTRWLDGVHGGPGARFVGANKSGSMRWSRPCTITAWEPNRLLQYRTKGPWDSTDWTFLLEPTDGGTRITQTFRGLQCPVWWDRLIWALMPAHRDRVTALRGDLERLAALAAATT